MAKSIPDENQSAKAENVCIAPENLSALIDGEYELTPKESEQSEALQNMFGSPQIVSSCRRRRWENFGL